MSRVAAMVATTAGHNSYSEHYSRLFQSKKQILSAQPKPSTRLMSLNPQEWAVDINMSVDGMCVQFLIIVHNKHNNITGSESNALDTGDS